MNCNSCNSLLKPGANFCTKCGARQEISHTDATTKDSTPTADKNTSPETDKSSFSMIKQKVFWNIQPGEVARSIKEEEFFQYEHAQGVIVNDGTTAYIKSGGKVIAEIHGGNYDFIPPAELNKLLEERIGGLSSLGNKAWRWLTNLVLGTPVRERVTPDENDELKKFKSLDQVLEYLRKGEIFAITLKQDREFQLIFGDIHQNIDEYANFTPMKIPTKLLDLEVGMRAFFRIKDFNEFSSYYLTDKNSVHTAALANLITPVVQSVLKELMHDMEPDNTRLGESIRQKVEDRLKLTNFHGIELQHIVEISAENDDLERFRQLSKELYLSEKELDYLHRSNDFINRLNAEIDEQSVYSRKREVDIFKKLKEIDKDEDLTKDELEKFYMLLRSEKRIREAQNDGEVQKVLFEIEQTGLLRKEQINILKDEISSRTEQRGFAFRLMQLNNANQYEKTRIGSLQDIQLQTVLHDLNLTRQKDNYADERFYKERERKRAEVADEREDIDFIRNVAQQERQAQLDALSRIQNIESEKEDRASQRRMSEVQQHLDANLAKERETTERLRVQQDAEIAKERELSERFQGKTEQQIMAINIQGMDAEAQKEYARSFSAGKDVEQERLLKEQLLKSKDEEKDSYKELLDRMERMSYHAMDKVVEAGKSPSQREQERADEYKQMHEYEQERHNRHQDIALNYTTRTTASSAGNQQAGQPLPPSEPARPAVQTPATGTAYTQAKSELPGKVCARCNKLYDVNERFCEICGDEI